MWLTRVPRAPRRCQTRLHACEVGEAVLTIASGTAAVKFVVVWKQVDGQWRLHRDIWNGKGN